MGVRNQLVTTLASFAALAGFDGSRLMADEYKQAPGLVLEAEQLLLVDGFEPVRMGEGNLLVDTGGTHSLSGERVALLQPGQSGLARGLIRLPEKGTYRLWVRYEHVPGTAAPLTVRVMQGNLRHEVVIGLQGSPRYAPGDLEPRVRHPQTQEAMGLYEEAFTLEGLQSGEAWVELVGSELPAAEKSRQTARSIDCLVLTRDVQDTWRAHHARQTPRYPVLDLVRDLNPPQWEARFRHQGDKGARPTATHLLTRQPWGASTGPLLASDANPHGDLAPGAWSAWVAIPLKETTSAGMTVFNGPDALMEMEIRPVGGGEVTSLAGRKSLRAFLPPYPGFDDKPMAAETAQKAVLATLAGLKPPGKKPASPLVFAGFLPVGAEGEYGKNYARLHAALGLVAWHPGSSGSRWRENLREAGAAAPVSAGVAAPGNAPLPRNVEPAKLQLQREGLLGQAAWYDLGDDWDLAAWVGLYLDEEVEKARVQQRGRLTHAKILNTLWIEWLDKNRPGAKATDYWLGAWGVFDKLRMRPDASAEAARGSPLLYLDSVKFYEGLVLPWLADGARRVRRSLGRDVRVGATCNTGAEGLADPLNLVLFKSGAADWIRPAGAGWRQGLLGSVALGLIDEECRAALRGNPRGTLRAQVLADVPGGTTDDFLREAITHLAHGAGSLDLGGVGMEETQPGHHIDHRSLARYQAVRDLTHAVGFVEDLLATAQPVVSPVAVLLSSSTLRWDVAGVSGEKGNIQWQAAGPGTLRTTYQLERLGIHTAFTALGCPADVVLEEECSAEGLAGRKVLVLVGDCLPEALAGKVEAWVRQGGTLLATASAGRWDELHRPQKAFDSLLGLARRVSAERDSHVRGRWELPGRTTLDAVAGPSWFMPALAVHERVETAEGTEVVARFQSDRSPAVCLRRLGEGRVISVSALPGLAALWTAVQPGDSPDQGEKAHRSPVRLDPGARQLLDEVLQAADVERTVRVELESGKHLVDARLLQAEGGYVLPMAHHGKPEAGSVVVRVRLPREPKRVASAWHGQLPCVYQEGEAVITLPVMGAVDLLRLDMPAP